MYNNVHGNLCVYHQTYGSACAWASTWLSCKKIGRNTSPYTAQAVHFKYTASQSVNSESDLSLRGPESTVWCTMVPTSGSLHRPMLQFVSCFQGAPREGNEAKVHGHPWTMMRRTSVVTFRFDARTTSRPQITINLDKIKIFGVLCQMICNFVPFVSILWVFKMMCCREKMY